MRNAAAAYMVTASRRRRLYGNGNRQSVSHEVNMKETAVFSYRPTLGEYTLTCPYIAARR